jgi:GDP-4-dehydro-6-deoxy-D-mannose reductase
VKTEVGDVTARPALLLTGGTGFIGSHLAPRLAALLPDFRLVMVVRGHAATPDGAWEMVSTDLTDEAALDALIEVVRPSIVVHLAAESTFGPVAVTAEPTWRLNVAATFTLARAIARYAPACMVFFTSTAQVYGASFLDGPVSETSRAAPLTSYGVSKLAAERILQDILAPTNQLIIVRAFNQCGPGQITSFVLPSFAQQVARAELSEQSAFIQVGNLEAERDFLHVSDAVEAYLALIRMRASLPSVLTINVASGQAWKLRTLLEMLCAQARRPIEVRVDSTRMRPSDLPQMVGHATLLHQLTGWSPRLTMSDILQDLLRYYRAREIVDQPSATA